MSDPPVTDDGAKIRQSTIKPTVEMTIVTKPFETGMVVHDVNGLADLVCVPE